MLQMFCVGMTDTLTIGIPLQILKFLAADFDGVMDTQRIQQCVRSQGLIAGNGSRALY